jgi:endo-1,4-beta-xylanase
MSDLNAKTRKKSLLTKVLAFTVVFVFAFSALPVSFADGMSDFAITITSQPGSVTVTEGSITGSLNVSASLGSVTVVPGKTSDFPAPADLPRHTMPHDILTMWDGTPVTSTAQWEERKKEMRAMIEFYMYGPMHNRADDYTGYATGCFRAVTGTHSLAGCTPATHNDATCTLSSSHSNASCNDAIHINCTASFFPGFGWWGAHSAGCTAETHCTLTAAHSPGTCDHVSATSNQINVRAAKGTAAADFSATVTLPAGTPPAGGWPVIIGIGGVGQEAYAMSMGYATINVPAYSSRSGAFYTLYPYGSTWETQSGYASASAWNVSKLIDALEDGAGADLNLNPDFTIVTGTSRNGKYAAAAGAFDERITVTMPVVSGMGGVNMGRFTSAGSSWDMYTGPASLEHAPGTIGRIWTPSGEGEGIAVLSGQDFMNENIKALNTKGWEYLPFDMHFIAALTAGEGRYTYMVSGLNMEGTNGVPGMQWTYDLAQPVFEKLGLHDNLTIQIHKMSHGIDQEDFVKLFAYLDHMNGKHNNCNRTCDMSKYLVGTTDAVTNYFTNWTFTIDSLKTTPFASPENAAMYTRGKPCCTADCTDCVCADCKYTDIGECCEPDAPPISAANCVLIDFETEATSGNPRVGVGWTPPAGGGTVTDGVLNASSTNWNSGVGFTINLGNSLLGDYAKLTFDYSATGGTSGGADNPVSVYVFAEGVAVPGGGWLGDRAPDRMGQISYTNSAAMQNLELDLADISNAMKGLTGTIRLVIGKNQNPSTFSFDNIKLTAHSCNNDCNTCKASGLVLSAAESALTYQWFSNTTSSNVGGTAIDGATDASFEIPTDLTAGAYYFYCIVSADGVADAVSDAATVTVTAAGDNGGDNGNNGDNNPESGVVTAIAPVLLAGAVMAVSAGKKRKRG